MYSTIFILSRVMMVVHDRWADGGAKMAKYQRLNANTLYVAAILFSRSSLHRESLPCLPNNNECNGVLKLANFSDQN